MSRAIDTERYRHLTGDYYWDADRVRPLWWIVSGTLSIVAPPVGLPFLAFFAAMAVTSRTAIEQTDDAPEPAFRDVVDD